MSEEQTVAANPTEPADASASIRNLTRAALAVCAFMLLYYLIADRYTPYTSHARVTGNIIPVVPQVSGEIISVPVAVNQRVNAGDVLLQINPADYELAVRKAEANLEQTGQDIGAGTENLAVAEAELSQANTQLAYYKTESKRVFELERRGILPVADGDKARAEVEKAEANVIAAQAKLQRAEQKLGDQGVNNPKIQSAISALQDARLDLARTTITAPVNGGVTSVAIAAGNYAKAGQPLMTFVSAENVWIEAYLRENNLGNIKPGDTVDIALDMAPGRVFAGEVVSVGFAVDWENNAQAGQLQDVSAQRNWLRSAQRFPVVIRFNDDSAKGLRKGGGQADIIIYTSQNWLTNSLAWMWIRLVSLMSYAY
jgi:multidrug resistance efflux pump